MIKSNCVRALGAFGVVLAMSGCANMKSHDELASQMQASRQSGGVPAAISALEASATSDSAKKELLYNLERGELLRMNRQYKESTDAFLVADEKVKEWEDTAKTNPQKLLGTVGAAVISERLKDYEGQDYEKVWLTTRLALNRVAAGDLDTARVDIKRTHEREAVIAEFRAKQTAEAEEEAKAKGVNITTPCMGEPLQVRNPHAGSAWWLTVDGQKELAAANGGAGLARKPGAELSACVTPG